LKVLLWNFIKYRFEFAIIKKLDYNFTTFKGLEEFYEEVFEMYAVKFENVKCEHEHEHENGHEHGHEHV